MRALITGAAGQDGTILATLLHRDNADIIGVIKPESDATLLRRYVPAITLVECDLADVDQLQRLVVDTRPDRIFNLGGISSIMESVNNPELTQQVNVAAVEAIVSGMRHLQSTGAVEPRLVEAASGTVFEGADRAPQTEQSAFSPSTPYARSKAAVVSMLREVRANEGLFVTSAILYNHESPLRGEGFVTRKITRGVARIAAGQQQSIELGDIEVARDWGWAPDYVRGMRLMLEADRPADFILATGISHRLNFFVKLAFRAVGIHDWQAHVDVTNAIARPVDTNILVGDSRAAYRELGWRHTVDFDHMAVAMVNHDVALLQDPNALWLDF